MKQETIILIGRSGSGKGTQALFIEDYLKKNSPEHPIFQMETGDRFREFVKGDTYSAGLSREINDHGGLQPSFIAVWLWAGEMIKGVKGSEHMILDGSPRTLSEAHALDSAFNFYKKYPTVVYLDVHNDHAHDRLHKRGRADDTSHEKRERRFKWFDDEVMKAVEYYRDNPDYNFIHIDGNPPIESVRDAIFKALKWQ